eukprot:8307894-Karenia_brevis.AAC.1
MSEHLAVNAVGGIIETGMIFSDMSMEMRTGILTKINNSVENRHFNGLAILVKTCRAIEPEARREDK